MKYHFRNFYFILCFTLIFSIIFDITVKDFKFGIVSTFISYIMGVSIYITNYITEFYFFPPKRHMLYIFVSLLILQLHDKYINIFTLINISSFNYKTYILVTYVFYSIFSILVNDNLVNQNSK